MFQQLLESNAVVRPRVGGGVLSAIAHAAVIAAAVALTANARESRIADVFEPRARFIPVTPPAPTPPITQARSVAGGPSLPSVRGAPALPVVGDIVVGIPPIDLSRAVVSADDFASGRRGSADGTGLTGDGRTARGVPGGPWLEFQVDKPVLLAPGSPAARYPEALRAAGIAGEVLAEFVVDTLGRVEEESVRLLAVDHALFGAEIRRLLPRLRFLPAEADGRKVRQLVRLPFRFDLHS